MPRKVQIISGDSHLDFCRAVDAPGAGEMARLRAAPDQISQRRRCLYHREPPSSLAQLEINGTARPTRNMTPEA